VLCRLIRPAVLPHLAAPKTADKHGRGPSSDTESDSGDSRYKDQKQVKKKKKYKTRYSKEWQKMYPFLKACSTYVSEKGYKFLDSLEVHAFGSQTTAFGDL